MKMPARLRGGTCRKQVGGDEDPRQEVNELLE